MEVFPFYLAAGGGDADSEELETAMLPLGWLVICVSARPGGVFLLGTSCIFSINKILGELGRELQHTKSSSSRTTCFLWCLRVLLYVVALQPSL